MYELMSRDKRKRDMNWHFLQVALHAWSRDLGKDLWVGLDASGDRVPKKSNGACTHLSCTRNYCLHGTFRLFPITPYISVRAVYPILFVGIMHSAVFPQVSCLEKQVQEQFTGDE